MEINADFSKRAVVHAAQMAWVPSPMQGVERKMLDRIGDEVARATSIVRYAPGSHFSPHVHGGGEEFLVLDGVFQDEHGDFPAGSYVRNPPQSRHTPGSEPGCTIFVKLWQFDPDDRTPVQTRGLFDRRRKKKYTVQLHRDERETVQIQHGSPGSRIIWKPIGGVEILCLAGSFTESDENFGPQSWLRLPVGAVADLTAGPDGCLIWVKCGHLRFVEAPAVQAE